MENPTPGQSYIICAVPRSGSTLLSQGLAKIGVGNPDEYFVSEHLEAIRQRLGIITEPHDYVQFAQHVIQKTTDKNQLFALKIMFPHMSEFISKMKKASDYTEKDTLERLFPNCKYIFIYRLNHLRQAISLVRASQSQVWRISSYSEEVPYFDRYNFESDQIDKALSFIAKSETGWVKFFQRNNIRPLQIVYESFIENYEETIQAVLSFLDIPESRQPPIPDPPLIKQGDDLTDQWVKMYHQHKKLSSKLVGDHLTLFEPPIKQEQPLVMGYKRKNQLPDIDWDAFEFGMPGWKDTKLDVIRAIDAQLSEIERIFLFVLVAGLQPDKMLEIGTAQGGSTQIIFEAMDYVNKGHLFTVDPDPKLTNNLLQQIGHRVTVNVGHSPDILGDVFMKSAAPFDIAFIDGNHSRRGVMNDILGCLPYMNDLAYLLFHDAHYHGVKQGIDAVMEMYSHQLQDVGLLVRQRGEPNEEGQRFAGMRLLVFSRKGFDH